MPNFVERVDEAAARFGSLPAVEWAGTTGSVSITYANLAERSARIATWLQSLHVSRGDRVAIWAANSPDWVAAFLGVLRLGGVVVPLDTSYSPEQVATVVDDSGARLLVTSQKLSAPAEHALGTRDIRQVTLPDPGTTSVPPPWAAFESSATLAVADNDAAVLLYTSGTTADPKGVVLTHANLDAERDAAFRVVHVDETDVILGVLPLFHALAEMANLLLPLSVGARVIFLETVSSTTLLEALQTRGVTVFACVPQFFYLIHQRIASEIDRRSWLARQLARALIRTNAALRDTLGVNVGPALFARAHHALGRRMRLLITGGSRFDPAILRDLYGLGFSILNGYGLTETSGGATIVRPGDRFTTSVGQPFPGVEIKIRPSDARSADDHADGEVLIRGPIVMREYFGRPDATTEVLDDGWLSTGDLGRLDAEGRLYITGRAKDVIVLSSGKNIYPEEIEAHYRQSMFIRELAVVGLSTPGQPASERLHGVVVPDDQVMRERGVVNVRERIRFEIETLSVQLPAHKRLLTYDVSLEPLPRTTTGKLRRQDILRRVAGQAPTAEAARALTNDEHAWVADAERAALLTLVGRTLQRPNPAPDANLELDLGLDSMERVELLTTMEHEAGRQVPAETRARMFTVRQLIDGVLASPLSEDVASVTGGKPWEVVLQADSDPDLVRELSRPKRIRAFAIYLLLQVIALAARVLLGWRVHGRRHLPRKGATIVSPNHQTFIDGVLVAAALPFSMFQRIFFVGAAEFFETPLAAWLARTINIVPLDPDANLVRAMQAAAAGLRLGKVLILFPEGERSIDGRIKTFRKGVAILASHLDVPVVPAGIDGLFPLWPRGHGIAWARIGGIRRAGSRLVFGQPVQLKSESYATATASLQAAVTSLLADGSVQGADRTAVLER